MSSDGNERLFLFTGSAQKPSQTEVRQSGISWGGGLPTINLDFSTYQPLTKVSLHAISRQSTFLARDIPGFRPRVVMMKETPVPNHHGCHIPSESSDELIRRDHVLSSMALLYR